MTVKAEVQGTLTVAEGEAVKVVVKTGILEVI